MRIRIVALFTFIFVPGLAVAQDDVIKDFGPQNAEKFITEGLKSKVVNKVEDANANRIIFETPQGQFDVMFSTAEKSKNLLFKYEYAQGKAGLDKVNEWNRKSTYTKVAISPAGKLSINGGVNLDAGASYKQLKAYYEEIQRERADFEDFVFPKKNGLLDSLPSPHHFVLFPVAQGQDEQIKEFSAQTVEKFIVDGMKAKVEGRNVDAEKNQLVFLTPPGHFDVVFRMGAKKSLVFQFPYVKDRTATLQTINDFNSKSTHARAVLDNGRLTLMAGVPLDAGMSMGQLKAFYDRIQAERQSFEDLTAPKKGALGDPEKKGAQGDPSPRGNVVRQGFPAASFTAKNPAQQDVQKSDTGWEIEWDFAPVDTMRVFRIVSARFYWKDVNGKSRAVTVARNLQLVEAFTQYDDARTCWLDIAKVGLYHVPGGKDLLGPACVGPGDVYETTIPVYDRKKKADVQEKVHVHKELHYDGMRWMSVYGGYNYRKGEKLVLWNAIASGNYVYLMEYNFTDDGRIVCRLGFTAHNYFDRAPIPGSPYGFRKDNGDVHPHIGCWRFDFDLTDAMSNQGGPPFNDLKLVRRVFEKGKFRQDERPFPGDDNAAKNNVAREGKAKWIAKNFTLLRAESQKVKNSRGMPIAYDLISTRTGSAEDLMPIHQAGGADMAFVNYDFWVTRTPTVFQHYYQLPKFEKGQPIAGQATTIWHSVPALHVPRDEDFAADGVNAAKGAALTEWIGFTLRPRNLFDGTPLFKAGN